MDDAGAMEGGDPSREPDRDRAPLLESDRRAPRDPRLKKLALVERHRRIEAALPSRRQFEDLRHPRTVHVRADPCFAHERRMMGRDRRHLRLREFERRVAALDLVPRGENPAVAAVRDERVKRKAVDGLADRRRRDQGELHDRTADIGGGGRRQRHHVEDQRGAIIGAAGVEGGRDQRFGGVVGSGAVAQGLGDPLVGQEPVHAVAAQEKPVMQRDRLRRIVEARLALGAERARQHPRLARAAVTGMVLGETGETVAPQPIGAGIADVQEMGDPAAQDERGEGARHPLQLGVLAAKRVDPGVERADHPRPGAADLHGLRQVPEAVKKTAHGELGGDASALRAAHPVGDRRHHLAARLGQFRADDRGGEILVLLARSLIGKEPDARPYPRPLSRWPVERRASFRTPYRERGRG